MELFVSREDRKFRRTGFLRKLEVLGFNISNLEGRAGGELLIFILESRVCNHQVIDMHTV